MLEQENPYVTTKWYLKCSILPLNLLWLYSNIYRYTNEFPYFRHFSLKQVHFFIFNYTPFFSSRLNLKTLIVKHQHDLQYIKNTLQNPNQNWFDEGFQAT